MPKAAARCAASWPPAPGVNSALTPDGAFDPTQPLELTDPYSSDSSVCTAAVHAGRSPCPAAARSSSRCAPAPPRCRSPHSSYTIDCGT
ncbi:LCCL domain-containing protein [Actinoplanes sp. NPDC049668]|uniref:LCCL domain-containing protein n=1 Tax=unclassified Actinoplanes TaxID=2626549 RepID=UPI0033AD19CD